MEELRNRDSRPDPSFWEAGRRGWHRPDRAARLCVMGSWARTEQARPTTIRLLLGLIRPFGR